MHLSLHALYVLVGVLLQLQAENHAAEVALQDGSGADRQGWISKYQHSQLKKDVCSRFTIQSCMLVTLAAGLHYASFWRSLSSSSWHNDTSHLPCNPTLLPHQLLTSSEMAVMNSSLLCSFCLYSTAVIPKTASAYTPAQAKG